MDEVAATAATRLDELAVLRVSGGQARPFLQGQLSCDVNALTPGHALLASCNSPQGRVQAVPLLLAQGTDIVLVAPRELRARLAERLRRYVLRAKVTVTPADDLACYHVDAQGLAMLAAGLEVPSPETHAVRGNESTLAVRTRARDPRTLLIASNDVAREHGALEDGSAAWRLAEIRAGRPQIYEATWEAFVAQMLNLDLLDAISLTKGCYTGQEIIARAHYRGAIKRRMIRLRTDAAAPPPGARIVAGDGHAGDVVYAENRADGAGAELLAVVPLAKLAATLTLEGGEPLERLELPYDPGLREG